MFPRRLSHLQIQLLEISWIVFLEMVTSVADNLLSKVVDTHAQTYIKLDFPVLDSSTTVSFSTFLCYISLSSDRNPNDDKRDRQFG